MTLSLYAVLQCKLGRERPCVPLKSLTAAEVEFVAVHRTAVPLHRGLCR